MPGQTESFYSRLVRRNPESGFIDVRGLSQREQDIHFAMRVNGYSMLLEGYWQRDDNGASRTFRQLKPRQVVFFGPGGLDDIFHPQTNEQEGFTEEVFSQEQVLKTVRRLRDIDEDIAARVCLLFGATMRYLKNGLASKDRIKDAVAFCARMTYLGGKRSAEAIASAMAMYVFSGGNLSQNSNFDKSVFLMAEAIEEDSVLPIETRDLGLSQANRLISFLGKIGTVKSSEAVDIWPYENDFENFPTAGAEFHLPPNARKFDNFWERLAILNMSQFQQESYVQFSRNDREVIEIRMNPSIYPVTIGNWEYIRLLVPEINSAYFHVTINRNDQNFDDNREEDYKITRELRALGLLVYATAFNNKPRTVKEDELNFGQLYVGQTVRVKDGSYKYEGNWSGKDVGSKGQFSIYAGYADNLPYLAYYLSMALARPSILKSVRRHHISRVDSVEKALGTSEEQIKKVFKSIEGLIRANETLKKAAESGQQIIDLISP